MFHSGLLGFVQVHLDQARSVQLHSDSFANKFSWENQILQDVVVHGSQGTAENIKEIS